jgi:hypothetical protein
MQIRIIALAAAVLLAGPAFAADKVNPKPLIAQTLDGFMQDSAQIRKQMEPGGKYAYTSPSERARVEDRLTAMQKLLEAHATEADMRQEDKIALANAQEEINGILSHNDSERLVCEKTTPVGSHLPVTTCHTYGELMAQRQHAQKYLEDQKARPQQRASGG